MYSTIRRTAGHLGLLVERKSGDLKETLLKDVYNLYLFGEGTITSLPKNMLETNTKFASQGIQTDTVTCLEGTLFTTKAEVENLKAEMLDRISALQQTLLPDPNQRNSSNPSEIISLSQQTQPSPSENPVCLVTPSTPLPLPSVHNVSIHELPQSSKMQSKPEKSHKIVVAGDSLLHRMNADKMSVDNITSVKITKKGDSLSGSIYRSKNYISKHANDHIDLVLLAGTNDLANRKTSPEELKEELDKQVTELKGFTNLGHIFLCKIPHRRDFHVFNSKVVKFNKLLHERFSDTEEFITVINTIPLEFKFYYKDGLHFSNVGLSKFCSILLFSLHRVLAPSKLARRRSTRISYGHS